MLSEVSSMDIKYLSLLRKDVSKLLKNAGKDYDGKSVRVLDIAPQDHEGAAPYFKEAVVETLDIDPSSGATYIADLCASNTDIIDSEIFDVVICTEVLEHTLNPFAAVEEIRRVLKDGGIGIISTPYNFRIHGPLPDCWRFTEHGLRELFKKFTILKLNQLDDEERFLMPIHYTMVVRK
ncbi:methyltransferase domain-containing protein [bacterium]|nr:methyltransferase domain-containing protein [bacterium]